MTMMNQRKKSWYLCRAMRVNVTAKATFVQLVAIVVKVTAVFWCEKKARLSSVVLDPTVMMRLVRAAAMNNINCKETCQQDVR